MLSPAPATSTGWTAAQTAAVLVPIITLIGTIVAASVTYWFNQRAGRRERRAKLFAEALAAVEEYAEMPYRIRRRPSGTDARTELTKDLSAIQSNLAFHQGWIQVDAPEIAREYDALVRATKTQAGRQMMEAWREPVLVEDEQMNLKVRYPRDQIDAARGKCITAMLKALGHQKWSARLVPLPGPASDPLPTTGKED